MNIEKYLKGKCLEKPQPTGYMSYFMCFFDLGYLCKVGLMNQAPTQESINRSLMNHAPTLTINH